MKRLITRPRSLLLAVALAVVAALCTVSTAGAASSASADPRAPAASSAQCNFVRSLKTCESTDPTVAYYDSPTGDIPDCTFVFDVAWGDGASTKATVVNPSASHHLVGKHTYAAPEAYTITVTVKVAVGTCTGTNSVHKFTLANRATVGSTGPGPVKGLPWSGYVTRITYDSKQQPTSYDTFVSASWKVPAPDCKAGLGPVGASDSIWVGLGGLSLSPKQDPASGNLVQAGITTFCQLGKLQKQFAFYQVLPPQSKEQRVGGPVNSGEIMKVSVRYDGPSSKGTHYSIAISDYTAKGHLNWRWSKTFVTAFGNVPDSADWIVESGQLTAPVCLPVVGWCTPGVNAPLADFGTGVFTQATYKGLDGIGHLVNQSVATQFVDTFAGVPLEAVSSILNGEFALIWEHSGP
jgi:hypothetical protein